MTPVRIGAALLRVLPRFIPDFTHQAVMIAKNFYRLLQCPTCGSRDLVVVDAGVHCAQCHSDYPRHDGYIDLMPRGIAFGYVSKYVSEEEQLAEELDYRELAPPLLAAGVRDRALARLLDFQPSDIVLDNGCGTAKHAVWNAGKVALMIGSDPATLFADAAVEQVTLAKADSRRLPFADNTFDKGFSIDVLEHFPRDLIDSYMAEMSRVLKPGGRFMAFSNTKEPSSLQPLVSASRWLGRQFVRAGVYDFERQARRKSDHVKALETWDDVLDAMQQAGLRPVKVVFWNSVFTSFVEHVLMKLGEAVIGRRRTNDGGRTTEDESMPASSIKHQVSSSDHPSSIVHRPSSGAGAGTDREIRARHRLRAQLDRSGPVLWALQAVTLLMELDLWLFGRLHSGSYFIVVEKPRTDDGR